MTTTFHFKTALELNSELLEAIKKSFSSKSITITIGEEMDTTEYLLSNDANKKMLIKSIEQAKNGELIKNVKLGK